MAGRAKFSTGSSSCNGNRESGYRLLRFQPWFERLRKGFAVLSIAYIRRIVIAEILGNPMGSSTPRTLAFIALSFLLLTSSCATLFSMTPQKSAETLVFK